MRLPSYSRHVDGKWQRFRAVAHLVLVSFLIAGNSTVMFGTCGPRQNFWENLSLPEPLAPAGSNGSVQTSSGTTCAMQAATAPRPWNEPVRVQYLKSLDILDTVSLLFAMVATLLLPQASSAPSRNAIWAHD